MTAGQQRPKHIYTGENRALYKMPEGKETRKTRVKNNYRVVGYVHGILENFKMIK